MSGVRYPAPLPESLTAGPFTVGDAGRAGVPRGRLRAPDLEHVTHDVYAVGVPEGLWQRATAYGLVLSGHTAYSHVTAARLWGLPLPSLLEADTRLHVVGDTGHGAVERAGCIAHRGAEIREIVTHSGVRLTGIADTWVDLGSLAPRLLGRDDLVVVADAILGSPGDGADARRRALELCLAARVRPRGKRILTEVLLLSRAGSASPMETRARLMFHDGGLPEPELNVDVLDRWGGWLLRGDFLWREQRVIGEYQGAGHADRRQLSLDVERRELAVDHGWRYVEIFAEDVFQIRRRERLLRRLRTALGVS